MILLGSIEKNAALWDKLLTKGLMSSQSIGRLAKGIPSHLGATVSNSSMLNMLNGLGNVKESVGGTFKDGLLSRLRMQIGANRPPLDLSMASKQDFVGERSYIRDYANRFRGGKVPFKPTVMNDVQSGIFKNRDSLAQPSGLFNPSYNGIQATDPQTLRHELGHFFSYQRLSPAKSLILRQRIIEVAKKHYPELIPPAIEADMAFQRLGRGPQIAEEAAAHAIASSGKSQAAQRVRQHYAAMPNERPQDAELIQRANQIDPSGVHSSVINHLLHNYKLNQFEDRISL